MTKTFEELRKELKVLIKDNSYERKETNDPKSKSFRLDEIDGDWMGYELIVYPKSIDEPNKDYWLKLIEGFTRETILTIRGGTMSYTDIADTIIGGILKNKKYRED